MEYLNWKQSLEVDESIEKIDYYEYDPHTGTDLNNIGDIRIVIQNQDNFLLPSQSYLYIEGVLKHRDSSKISEDQREVTIINNGLMYLFNRVSYQIGNQEIEGYPNPGVASTIKSLLTYPQNYMEGMNFLWSPDTNNSIKDNAGFEERCNYIIRDANPQIGSFSAIIPLSHIFGFCENYRKIVYGVKHELVLRRTNDDNAIFKTGETTADQPKVKNCKIVLSKLSWRMPHITPADAYKIKLYEDISKKSTISIGYLNRQCDSIPVTRGLSNFDWRLSVSAGAEKPRYIILAFQTEREGDQNKNTAIFDHCNVVNAYVQLNSERYPEADLQLNYLNNIYSTAYKMLTNYFNEVLGKECCSIKLSEYKNLYPLLVFDISQQSERLQNSVTDIRIKVSFNKNMPKDTIAYALILSDRILQLQSDGNKMNIIY
jgi:hypothetical protein